MDTPKQWVVVTGDHTAHHFEEQEAALSFAVSQTWTNRATNIRSPDGQEYLIMRRDPRIRYAAIHSL